MYLTEVTNTLSAGWLELKLAIWFGKKETLPEYDYRVVLSTWRGKRYLIDSYYAD